MMETRASALAPPMEYCSEVPDPKRSVADMCCPGHLVASLMPVVESMNLDPDERCQTPVPTSSGPRDCPPAPVKIRPRE